MCKHISTWFNCSVAKFAVNKVSFYTRALNVGTIKSSVCSFCLWMLSVLWPHHQTDRTVTSPLCLQLCYLICALVWLLWFSQQSLSFHPKWYGRQVKHTHTNDSSWFHIHLCWSVCAADVAETNSLQMSFPPDTDGLHLPRLSAPHLSLSFFILLC